MATIDLRKAQKGVTGQKITPLYPEYPVNPIIEEIPIMLPPIGLRIIKRLAYWQQ